MIDDRAVALAFETTWPAPEQVRAGGFIVGRGFGAGGRVSSARKAAPDWTEADLDAAEALHAQWQQPALFRVSDGDLALRQALALRGYAPAIPTAIMACDIGPLAEGPIPPVTTFAVWQPLAIQRDIWAAGNISAPRQQIMDHVTLPKTSILGRVTDRAAGAAFVAAEGEVAMIHAIEVLPPFRRMGLAGWILRQAAQWGQSVGAKRLVLAVGRGNDNAVALYGKMGFRLLGGYDYWQKPQA